MEMCLAWHWPPHVVESWPRGVRRRMLSHFHWRNQRAIMKQQNAEFERRAAEQQHATAAGRPRGRKR